MIYPYQHQEITFSESDIRRFWGHVVKSEEGKCCWNFSAGGKGCAYGRITIFREDKKKTLVAHVASWMIHKGPVTPGMVIAHDVTTRVAYGPITSR